MKKLRLFAAIAALLGAGCGADVAGNWNGTWASSVGTSGSLTLALRQSGDDLTGVATLGGSACLPSATVEGNVDGERVELELSTSDEVQLKLFGEVESDTAMTGTYVFGAGGCAGQSGTWQAAK